ncbi:MAG: hypothetical protein H7338_08170 [Candidatus Sericytochromatia bacterium]|nr:hypothetical protein [Candidatus Sericytochromatia bacterium]
MKWHVGLLTAALVVSGPLVFLAMAEKITIDAVPPAVRATIDRETAGKPVTEVETQDVAGQTAYQVEWIDGNRELEILIDANGNLLPPNTGGEAGGAADESGGEGKTEKHMKQ